MMEQSSTSPATKNAIRFGEGWKGLEKEKKREERRLGKELGIGFGEGWKGNYERHII